MSSYQKLVGGIPTGTQVQGTDIGSGAATSSQLLAANGSAGAAFRSLLSGDIPNNAANTSGTAANITATTNATLTSLTALTSISVISFSLTSASNTNLNLTSTFAGISDQYIRFVNTNASNTQVNWQISENYNANGLFAITPSTAAAGTTFINDALTINSSGIVTIPSTTDASSSTAAALISSGGLAVAKSANIGASLTVGTELQANQSASPSSTGANFSNPTAVVSTGNITGVLGFMKGASTASANSNQITGGNFRATLDASNTQNWTSTVASNGPGLTAFQGITLINSGASGTISQMVGGYFRADNNSGTATVSSRGGAVFASGSGAVTNDFGLMVGQPNGGTNNADIIFGTTTQPTGNYGLYQGDTYKNYLGGTLQVNAAVATSSYTTSTSTSGTVTVTSGTPGLLITGAGGTTLTIKLPSSPIDGQQCWIASQGAFTTITWQDSGGTAGNVIGGQAALGGVNRGQTFVYSLANTKWFAIS